MTVSIDQNSPSSIGLVGLFAGRHDLRRLIVALSIFCAFVVWTIAIHGPLGSIEGSDDAFYLEVAHLWTQGVLPYVGAFDIKPPGFFAILAAAETLLGPSLQTLKAVSIVFDAVTATALFFIGCRMGSRGLGLFAALLYPFLSQFVTNNVAYTPLAAFTTLAFLAALSPLPIMNRAILTGLAIGAACAVKQTAAFEAVALLIILWRAPDASARRLSVGLAFGLTAAIAPLGFLLYFAAHGAAGALIDDVVMIALRS